tara:strand:- start:3356 stop:4243 length:888 start_codon:yes stop_codon:yes gene_type:complete
MQQGMDKAAERCYKIALNSKDIKTVRAANKNLGLIHLWRGEWEEGWLHHGKRYAGEPFERTQWKGEPLNGKSLIIWNDIGMGDLFQFVRYTKILIERGENIILAVDKSQINLVEEFLCWPLKVIDRNEIIPPPEDTPHIPLMSLVGLLDPTTTWGRNWTEPTWRIERKSMKQNKIGICWASNPQDKTMYNYKSSNIEKFLYHIKLENDLNEVISLQTGENASHKRHRLSQAESCWINTINQIAKCKKVHSVDTAVAHLAAGSMVPVKLHLAKTHDWRWKGEGNKWYCNLSICEDL